MIAYGREPQATEPVAAPAADTTAAQHKRRQWAELMRRASGYDLLSCGKCGGKMVLRACIMQRGVVAKILNHLGLPSDAPRPAKARASPSSRTLLDHVA